MIYEPIKVDKLVSQISAVSDNIEDISEEVQNMTDVIGEVEDTIKDCFYFWLILRLSKGLLKISHQWKYMDFENSDFCENPLILRIWISSER